MTGILASPAMPANERASSIVDQAGNHRPFAHLQRHVGFQRPVRDDRNAVVRAARQHFEFGFYGDRHLAGAMHVWRGFQRKCPGLRK